MRTNMRWMALVGLAMTGCLEAEDAEDAELGEAAQEVTTQWVVSWVNGQLDLGSSADKTCYLIGVRGSLKGWTSWSSSEFTTARAAVFIANGRWIVETSPGDGGGIAAKVGCVGTVANRVFFSSSFAPTPTNNLINNVPSIPHRQCFITGISGKGHGWTAFSGQQQSPLPGVGLMNDGIRWQFIGRLIPHSDNQASGGASAVCVNLPDSIRRRFDEDGPINRRLSGTANSVCGLTAIAGVFVNAPTSGGIELYHSGTPTWDLSVAANYGATTTCVE